MRPTLFLLTLLLASLAAHAQQTTTTVRDRLWIFTVIGGGNNKKSPDSPGGNTTHYIDDFAPGGSRMTPAEGAFNAPASRLKKSCRGVKSNFYPFRFADSPVLDSKLTDNFMNTSINMKRGKFK